MLHDIDGLQKKVDSNLVTARISMLSIEKSVSALKIGVDQASNECHMKFQAVELKNN